MIMEFKVKTFDEYIVLQRQLNEDIIIFQPTTSDISSIDMCSLADILTKLRDSGQVKENIVLLPPDINVFRAKLSRPKDNEDLKL